MTEQHQLMHEYATGYLEHNENLCRLIALLIHAQAEDIPVPKDKLIGDWDFAIPGQKVKVTWTNPYREEEGYLMYLPGFIGDDMYTGAIVHIPHSYEDENQSKWMVLKHLAIFADTVELQPYL